MNRSTKEKSEFTRNYNKLKANYYTVSKKILNYESKRELKDNSKTNEYTNEILAAYNAFVEFIRKNLSKQSEKIQIDVNEKFSDFYGKNFLRCLHTLNWDTVFTEKFGEINLDALIPYEGGASNENLVELDDNLGDLSPLNSDSETEESVNDIEPKTQNTVSNQTNLNNENKIEDSKMPLTKIEYHNMCTRTINTTYSGDPLGLRPFIDSIDSLIDIDDGNAFASTLKNCILMKLSGSARDCIPNTPDLTIAQIKKALEDTIKPESSIVVEGRMMALKADRTNFTDYAKRAEVLAEQLKRSLILEGMPHNLANRDTIRKTVELCRSNSNMLGVKTVLSSTKFADPKEVIATFVTQTRQESGEQQVLHFRSNRQQNSNRSNNQRGRNFTQRNYNGQNRNGNNFNRNGYQGNQNNHNSRGNFRGRRNGNYRNGNNYNNNRGGNRNILYTENGAAPPSGATQAQQVQLYQADNQNA